MKSKNIKRSKEVARWEGIHASDKIYTTCQADVKLTGTNCDATEEVICVLRCHALTLVVIEGAWVGIWQCY